MFSDGFYMTFFDFYAGLYWARTERLIMLDAIKRGGASLFAKLTVYGIEFW